MKCNPWGEGRVEEFTVRRFSVFSAGQQPTVQRGHIHLHQHHLPGHLMTRSHPQITIKLSQNCGHLCCHVYREWYLWGGIGSWMWGGPEECQSVEVWVSVHVYVWVAACGGMCNLKLVVCPRQAELLNLRPQNASFRDSSCLTWGWLTQLSRCSTLPQWEASFPFRAIFFLKKKAELSLSFQRKGPWLYFEFMVLGPDAQQLW